jgi:2-polyprenyl-3-methyl-5-hydroxy-6-metoxy-1,4-benzoquinol methylase
MSDRPSAALPPAACRICGRETTAAFAVGDRNRGVGDRTFVYRRCRSCKTLFIDDVPDNLAGYYRNDHNQPPPVADLDRAADAEAWKLALLQPFRTGQRLVEIGSAFGIFARAAQRAGWNVTAIEMDAKCCSYLEDVLGVRAINSDAPERALAAIGTCRAIALWHVFEHLQRPLDVLEQATLRLEPGGALAISTPNPDSLQFRLLRSRWAHVDAPRHLFLIPFATLVARAEALGLSLAHLTTTDPAGRFWNTFGWECAIRGEPAHHASTRPTRIGARLLGRAVAPVERRGLNGATYTVVFTKR